MGPSKIEWLRNPDGTPGMVWNPVTGCTPVSAGCAHCYAASMARRFWGDRSFSDVQCHPDRLDQPRRWRKPRMIFVNSMSDLFHPDVADEFIDQVLSLAVSVPRHTFMILTKRPARMLDFFNRHGATLPKYQPENIWLGVSVEDQPTANDRIPLLLKTPSARRFVSYEPAIGPVDFRADWFNQLAGWRPSPDYKPVYLRPGIDWLIVGGESGPGARPDNPDWYRAARAQCAATNTAFFMKQLAGKALIPDDLLIRQFPHVATQENA